MACTSLAASLTGSLRWVRKLMARSRCETRPGDTEALRSVGTPASDREILFSIAGSVPIRHPARWPTGLAGLPWIAFEPRSDRALSLPGSARLLLEDQGRRGPGTYPGAPEPKAGPPSHLRFATLRRPPNCEPPKPPESRSH